MNINKAKFIIDLIMFIDFIIIALSGFILWFLLPSGNGAGRFGSAAAVLGLARHEWISMHNLTSVILIILLIIHLTLNRKWISAILRRKK